MISLVLHLRVNGSEPPAAQSSRSAVRVRRPSTAGSIWWV